MFWHEEINISHLHSLYSAGEINVVQLAKGLVARLKTTTYYAETDPDLMDIVMELNHIDAYSSYEDYCVAFDYLCEFGDEDNRLWIETEKPSSKYEIDEDAKATSIKVKMIEDYEVPDTKPIKIEPSQGIVRAIPATSTISSSSSSTRYNRSHKTRYLTDYEFDIRLRAKGIKPTALTRDFYTYAKEADDDFQNWLLGRVLDNISGYVKMKQEPVALAE